MDWSVKMTQQTGKNKTFLQALRHAFHGVVYGIRTEKNIQIQLLLGIVVVLFGFIFKVNHIEWLWLTQCIVLVFFAEFINTCLEHIVDTVTNKQYFTWAKHVKDMAAGVVLLVTIYTVIVATIIFIPKLF